MATFGAKPSSVKVAVGVVVPYPANQMNSFLYVFNNDEELWSLPAGGLELWENLQDTGRREALEETGCDVTITRCIGIYVFRSEHGNHVVSPHFAARYLSGELKPRDPHNREVRPLSLAEIKQYCDDGKLRSGVANVRPVEDYLAGKRIDLDRLVHLF